MLAALPFPDISPELFSFSIGGFTLALRWYALAYIVGILIAWRLVVAALKRPALWPNDTPIMEPAKAEDLLTWIIIGVVLGGRLGYVLFYQPAYYIANPQEILMFWQGGMSFHGGFLGVVVVSWVFAIRNNTPRLNLADVLTMSAPIGFLLGRLANFINAELWGRPTDVPWGVIFPGSEANYCPGTIGEIAGGFCARHPSQLYEAALEGLVLGALLLWLVFRRKSLKMPGLTFGVFLIGYGAARFVVEFVRQPDSQFVTATNPNGYALQLGEWGLTRGQELSVPMILVGVALIVYAMRKAPSKERA
ncbi:MULTISPECIES: prolipoprotein diacylglyceryl transferase [Halocynthiibacter]|uniref:Phosphatidylglycerol--prolipoprotein diacylglyceryl transferase n=1 Tax=Halocynthiibacter halioticoli TaxID=2986804 RepID=A0AAE3IZD0_9RHOB|nr:MULTISPECIES: prolipoprotein diacylglyceryl transferase [Halocynthiibacter]MCV6823716.1 prolipoprotein diacylglyceryl transferase [Halocynthiibacter halioticoli]MCW4056717.1 prolipoprotein diacylglyceryl transferase [Halocynthiibacter sp. SDUM655004]